MNSLQASLILAGALGLVTLGGCVQDNIPHESEAQSTVPNAATQQPSATTWPGLNELHGFANKSEGLLAEGNTKTLSQVVEMMLPIAERVATSEVPEGLGNPERLAELQKELRARTEALADAQALGPETIPAAVQELLPVVHELSHAAGISSGHKREGAETVGKPLTLDELGALMGPGHHGGTILEVTDDHLVHVELVLDPGTGTLWVYALDQEAEPTTFDDAMSAELIFEGWTNKAEAVRVILLAKTSDFSYAMVEGSDDKLKNAEWIAGRLSGRIRTADGVHALDAAAGWPPNGEADGHHGHHHH